MTFIAYLVGALIMVFYVVPKVLWLVFRAMIRYINPETAVALEATPEDTKLQIRKF